MNVPDYLGQLATMYNVLLFIDNIIIISNCMSQYFTTFYHKYNIYAYRDGLARLARDSMTKFYVALSTHSTINVLSIIITLDWHVPISQYPWSTKSAVESVSELWTAIKEAPQLQRNQLVSDI